jgi:hypothetical protein
MVAPAGAMLLGIVACSTTGPAPAPTIAPDCESHVNPTEDDLDYVLGFPGTAFDGPGWDRSFTVEPLRVTATWLDEDQGGLGYIDYLVYSCGLARDDLDEYASEDVLYTVLFADYQDVSRLTSCTSEDGTVTLQEIAGGFEGTDYRIRYWIMPRGETRLLTMTLAMPSDLLSSLDDYASKVFPQLPSCSP